MDERIWFYIIAGIIYFLAKRKKKPKEQTPPTQSSDRPQQSRQPVSFEDLLKEITEQRETQQPKPVPVFEEEEEDLPLRKMRAEQEAIKKEGANRQFADAESRKVYEESIKQAEGFDIAYEPDSHYESERLFKGNQKTKSEPTLADEIRTGLQNTQTARKAIIYGEILNRKY
jgi:hypothetical protein